MTDLEKSDVGQTAPVFQREDWSLFRTIDGLQQRAGVSKDLLPRLVLQELADNGPDNGAGVTGLPLPDRAGYSGGRWHRHRRCAGGYRAPVQHQPADGLDQVAA